MTLTAYHQITEAIAVSRREGVDYTAEKDAPEPYVERLHPRKLSLVVSDIIDETPAARTLRLTSPERRLPPFQAGQYLALALDVDGIRTSRPYSISSPPNQSGYYDITVQRVEGGLVSNALMDRVNRGVRIETSGPAGEFVHNPVFHSRDMVLVAAVGSGVTPFMSMVREILECGLERRVTLFYGSRDLDGAIRHEEFSALAARHDNFRYVPVVENPCSGYSGETGFMTGDLIRETLGDVDGRTFYVCGPQAMYDFCLPELENLGIARRWLRREMYGLPSNVDADPAWPEEISVEDVFSVRVRGGATLEAKAGEPLLATLERSGVVVPSLCRSGECSMCRVRILSGRVFQASGAKVRRSDRRLGYVHSCASYPLEDLEIAV